MTNLFNGGTEQQRLAAINDIAEHVATAINSARTVLRQEDNSVISHLVADALDRAGWLADMLTAISGDGFTNICGDAEDWMLGPFARDKLRAVTMLAAANPATPAELDPSAADKTIETLTAVIGDREALDGDGFEPEGIAAAVVEIKRLRDAEAGKSRLAPPEVAAGAGLAKYLLLRTKRADDGSEGLDERGPMACEVVSVLEALRRDGSTDLTYGFGHGLSTYLLANWAGPINATFEVDVCARISEIGPDRHISKPTGRAKARKVVAA